MRTQYTPEEVERFWSYVDKSGGDDACWPYTGQINQHGYGMFSITGRKHVASRMAAIITFGPVPEGRRTCHHCDNPPCCNPAHLYYGTALDNMRDMIDRGRANFFGGKVYRGEIAGKAKLTAAQVVALRREFGVAPFNVSERARQLGMTQPALRNAIIGVNWKHLPSVDELREAS